MVAEDIAEAGFERISATAYRLLTSQSSGLEAHEGCEPCQHTASSRI
jgi:hypothetical protein